jgi:hypothetical protein
MPGKHVRFQDIPPTPPSAYSQLSSLPSEGPITPPPIQFSGSPYGFKPLPHIEYHIHIALSPYHANAAKCDLSLPTKYIQLQSLLPPQILAEPATSPPLPCMTITCANLPWLIRVTPSGNSKHGPFVTVLDVLDAIHRSLRVSVTKAEFDKVQTSEEQRRINEAYRWRYKKMTDAAAYEQERSAGIRRVDFLMGKSAFAGLLSSGSDPERWELNLS